MPKPLDTKPAGMILNYRPKVFINAHTERYQLLESWTVI